MFRFHLVINVIGFIDFSVIFGYEFLIVIHFSLTLCPYKGVMQMEKSMIAMQWEPAKSLSPIPQLRQKTQMQSLKIPFLSHLIRV